MFRRIFRLGLFASALAIGAAVGCSVVDGVQGSGKEASEEREVGEVTEVTLSGEGELKIVPSDEPALVVTADDNLLPLIETQKSGKKLTLRTKSGYSLRPQTPIRYTLFVSKLDKLTVSGAGNATAETLKGESVEVKVSGSGNVTLKEVDARELTLTLSGAGNATLGGKARNLTAKVSGAGDIDAAGLEVHSAEVTISGAGNASVWATHDLKARVSGAGDIKYKGSPSVDKKVSGAGSIHAME